MSRNNSAYARKAFFWFAGAAGVGMFLSVVAIIMVLVLARARGRTRRADAVALGVLLIIFELGAMLGFSFLSGFGYLHVSVAYILACLVGVPISLIVNVCFSPSWVVALRLVTGGCCHGERMVPNTKSAYKLMEGQEQPMTPVVLGASPCPGDLDGSDVRNRGRNCEVAQMESAQAAPSCHQPSILGSFTDFCRQCLAQALRQPIVATLLIVGFMLLSFVSVFTTYGFCYCSNPTVFSTWVSRRSATKYCQLNIFCHAYVILGRDSSRMRLVGHIVAEQRPERFSATVCALGTNASPQDEDKVYQVNAPCEGPEWLVKGRVWEHVHISEDPRYTGVVLLNNLTARTTYRAKLAFTLGSSTEVKVILFRTMPGPHDTETNVTFLSGGDIDSGPNGAKIIDEALRLLPSPDFFFIGGDLTYSQNTRTCYLRVDYILKLLAGLRTRQGTSVPLLIVPGNHESGGYERESDWAKYYFFFGYFPHYDEDEPADDRVTWHKHRIGAHLGFIGLDSGCYHHPRVQVDYLERSLRELYNGWAAPVAPLPPEAAGSYPQVMPVTLPDGEVVQRKPPLVLLAYHNPSFPSLRELGNDESVAVRRHWGPLIDRYRVPLVLEFHDHVYKRTKPIFQEKVVAPGAGTIYIGDGGLGIERDADDRASIAYLFAKKIGSHNIQLFRLDAANRQLHVQSFAEGHKLLDEVTITMLG